MRRLWFGKKIILGCSLALVLLLFLSVAAYRNIHTLIETSREVAHTGEVLTTLETLLTQAQSAEVERGYLLTGDELFLAPYNAARQTLLPTLQQLQQLTADNPAYQGRLTTLKALIEQRLAFAQSIIDLQQAKESRGAIHMTQSERGRVLMAEIYSLIDGLRSEQIALLQQRPVSVVHSAQSTLWVIMVSNVLAFVVVAFAGSAIYRALSRRKAAERALLQAYMKLEQQAEKRPAPLSQANGEVRHEIPES